MSEIGEAYQLSALHIFIVIVQHDSGYSSTSQFSVNGGIFKKFSPVQFFKFLLKTSQNRFFLY